MREVVDIKVERIVPERGSVLRVLGLAPREEPTERIGKLIEEAYEIYFNLADPKGLFDSLTIEEFASVYEGQGLNEPQTPLAEIFPESNELALFALTLGETVSQRIEGLFESNDFALGYVVDAVASEGAEEAADRLEERFDQALSSRRRAADSSVAHLRYSPGYCGWHISGQRKLFDRLRPEEIGIRLNDSYLMQPLKSISGVVVSGEREIHFFDNNYRFCAQCVTKTCRERLIHILKSQ